MKKFLITSAFFLVAASALPGSAEAATLARPGNNLGLVARWSFDEGTGTSVGDSSGLNNTATFIGSPSWVLGKMRGAASFSGTGQYATTSVALPTSAYTKTAWIKLTDCTGFNNIISVAGVPTSSAFWAPSGHSCKLSTGHNGSWYSVEDSVGLVAAQWYFVAVTYDSSVSGGMLKLYKDGVLVDSATSISAPAAGLAEIGAYHENYFMKGVIDDARIYSRALSAGEIAALYNQTATTKIGTRVSYGLSGAYYDGMNFNTYVGSHTDSTVNFDPADSLGVSYANSSDGDTFSIRWTGYVKADYTGTYTFYTVSDDGARLYVNGSTVINSWIDQGPTEHSGTIALTAGQWYPIQLDFYENGGGATITLSWSEVSVSKQIIPAANLKPGTNDVKLNASSADLQGNGLANGLVGLWTFDGKDTLWSSSTAGTVTDKSGQGNTGTLTNMTQAGSVVIGKMGQALSFNGSSSYIVLPNNFASGLSGGKFTASAWVYANSLPSWGTIIKNWGFTTVGAFHFGLNGTFGDLDLFVAQSNGTPVETHEGTGTPLPTGSWQFVTAVADGSYLRLYRNGVAVGTPTSYNGTLKTSFAYTNIGVKPGDAGGADSGYWDGKIDDVRVYNRALSANEVKQLYDMGK